MELYPRTASAAAERLRLGFQVTDLATILTQAVECGGSLESKPTNTPWGLRAVLIDPDGNRVEVSQSRERED